MKTKTSKGKASKAAKTTRSAPAKPVQKAAARPVAITTKSSKPAVRAAAAPPAGRKTKTPEKLPPAPPRAPRPTKSQVAARRKDLERFRQLLLEKQRELMQAYSISKGDSRSLLDGGTEDYIDYAVNSYAKEFLLSLTELERKQLLLVEESLRRIDRGEFGRCQQCGEEIARKRLEVAPWAKYCIRCQELEEKGMLPESVHLQEDEDSEGEEVLPPIDDEAEADVDPEEEVLEEEDLVVTGGDDE